MTSQTDPKNLGLLLPYSFDAAEIRQARRAYKMSDKKIPKYRAPKLSRYPKHFYAYIVGAAQHPQASDPEVWNKIVAGPARIADLTRLVEDQIPLPSETFNSIVDTYFAAYRKTGGRIGVDGVSVASPGDLARHPSITEYAAQKLVTEVEGGATYTTRQILSRNLAVPEDIRILAALTMEDPDPRPTPLSKPSSWSSAAMMRRRRRIYYGR